MFLNTEVSSRERCRECGKPPKINIREVHRVGADEVTPLCANCALRLWRGILESLRDAGVQC